MAIVTTPLGFQKPDGGEAIRDGDNVIAANAQVAQDLIAAAQGEISSATARIGDVEGVASSALTTAATLTPRVTSLESTTAAQDVRIASVESAAFVGGGLLTEDPTDPGFFLVGA